MRQSTALNWCGDYLHTQIPKMEMNIVYTAESNRYFYFCLGVCDFVSMKLSFVNLLSSILLPCIGRMNTDYEWIWFPCWFELNIYFYQQIHNFVKNKSSSSSSLSLFTIYWLLHPKTIISIKCYRTQFTLILTKDSSSFVWVCASVYAYFQIYSNLANFFFVYIQKVLFWNGFCNFNRFVQNIMEQYEDRHIKSFSISEICHRFWFLWFNFFVHCDSLDLIHLYITNVKRSSMYPTWYIIQTVIGVTC